MNSEYSRTIKYLHEVCHYTIEEIDFLVGIIETGLKDSTEDDIKNTFEEIWMEHYKEDLPIDAPPPSLEEFVQMPIENMPLYINNGLMYRAIALWRLQIGR